MVDPATFEVDNPLPDGACWFRIITNSKHITRDKTLHPQALKRGQFTPPSPPKAWSHELSGAARCFFSTAPELEQYCENFVRGIRDRLIASGKPVPSAVKFAGAICRDASDLRFQVGNTRADTAHTPYDHDPAHADFVSFGTTDDLSLVPVELELRKRLRLIFPAEVQMLVSDCAQSRVAGI
jgi:hypothetical protein